MQRSNEARVGDLLKELEQRKKVEDAMQAVFLRNFESEKGLTKRERAMAPERAALDEKAAKLEAKEEELAQLERAVEADDAELEDRAEELVIKKGQLAQTERAMETERAALNKKAEELATKEERLAQLKRAMDAEDAALEARAAKLSVDERCFKDKLDAKKGCRDPGGADQRGVATEVEGEDEGASQVGCKSEDSQRLRKLPGARQHHLSSELQGQREALRSGGRFQAPRVAHKHSCHTPPTP
jgi:chromosome segregation ATPase